MNSGNNSLVIKREIQLIEEEKHQLNQKIYKIKNKVDGVQQKDIWLENSRHLREQLTIECNILERMKEQAVQLDILTTKRDLLIKAELEIKVLGI